VARGLLLVALVLAAGVGAFAFFENLGSSSSVNAKDTFCNSVGLAMQLAYNHTGGLAQFRKLVDKDADEVGGRALTLTKDFERALGRDDIKSAEGYLAQLSALCDSNGSPISTPVTT
jgi:hypothetical protein